MTSASFVARRTYISLRRWGRLVCLPSLLLALGCGESDETQLDPIPAGAAGQGGSAGTGGGAGDGGSSGAGQGGSGGAPGEPSACVDGDGAFAWPPSESVNVPAHESWKASVNLSDDPFLSQPDFGNPMRWVKFIVLASEPSKIYFQSSTEYPFHYEFARDRIPAFQGMTRAQFDAVTLASEGRQAVLGAVLVPLDGVSHPEYGVQLVSTEDLHPDLVSAAMETVAANVVAPENTRAYYFPSGVSATCIPGKLDELGARGVTVGSVDRWLEGDACHAPGWAVGKLVRLSAAEVDAAYLDGRLTPDDVLLLEDSAPAELPFVAGVLTLAPSTPNAHTAILARSYGVPFGYLRQAESRARAEALVGRRVVVSTSALPARDLDPSFPLGGCELGVTDLEALSDEELGELRALSAPPPIEVAAKRAAGAVWLPADGLVPADIDRVGGKAANFGLLRAVIGEVSPSPAIALTFDAWDAFMAAPAPGGARSLREEIAARLAPHAWPPDLRALDVVLEGVRDLIEDAPFPADLGESVRAALEGFDANTRIRFRSSTNVEDSETFTGAGLYDSATGCLADDLDADNAGPSLCNPEELAERGVFRAIKRVYASFYFRNAYLERLRRGVDETEVAMGVLVHYSVPDPEELANGVATLSVQDEFSRHAELVTQLGAVSVTNPDGTALPEQVNVDRYAGQGDFPSTLATSSLVPLGDHVLAWEDDYRSLMESFNLVADRYAQVTGKVAPFALDFEYKKVVPGELSVRQVRPLPIADTTPTVTPFLVGVAETLCFYGSERADAFASHRLKARIALDTGNLWLTAEQLGQVIYDDARVDYVTGSATATLEGDPASFPGAAHLLEQSEFETVTEDAWTAAAATWKLRARVPGLVPRSESPVRTLRQFFFELVVNWPEPQPYLGYDFESNTFGPLTRSEEGVDLWGFCPDAVTPDESFHLQDRSFSGPDGLSLRARYWFPPSPRGVTAGYTAPAVKWEETTITGLTTEPIVLRGYFSQTYAPYHHNFGGQYIFDPRLEPGLPASITGELAAADIAFLVVIDNDGVEDELWVSGLDGTLRRIGAD